MKLFAYRCVHQKMTLLLSFIGKMVIVVCMLFCSFFPNTCISYYSQKVGGNDLDNAVFIVISKKSDKQGQLKLEKNTEKKFFLVFTL